MVTSPPVIAPAIRNVPASMRSGIIVCVAPCNSRTPFTINVAVPSPEISAPIARRSSTRSVTSGSRAALLNNCFAFGQYRGHQNIFCPSDGDFFENNCAAMQTSAGFNARFDYTLSRVAFSAPICSRAFKCKSTGRAPIAHPPGRETRAWPGLPASGPRVNIGGAHRLNQFVRSFGIRSRARCEWCRSSKASSGAATVASICARSLPHGDNVTHARDVVQVHGLGVSKRGRHRGKRGIFCAADSHRAFESVSTLYGKLSTWSLFISSLRF